MVRKYTAQKPMEVIPEGAKAWPEMMSQEAGAMARFGQTVMSVTQKWQEDRDIFEVSKLQAESNDFHFRLMRQLEDDWMSGKFKTIKQFEQQETDYKKAREKNISDMLKGKRGRISDSVRAYTEKTKSAQGREFFSSLYNKEREFRSVETEKLVQGAVLRGNRKEAEKLIGLGENWLGLGKAQIMRERLDAQLAEVQHQKFLEQVAVDTRGMLYEDALTYINEIPRTALSEPERNSLIAQRERQEEIATASTDPMVRWRILREITDNPKTVTDDYLESNIKPDGLSVNDAEALRKIRDDKDHPLKTPRAQLYLNSLNTLYDERETDAEQRVKYDIANEKLMQFFTDNPKATVKQAAEFYDELISGETRELLDRILNPLGWEEGTAASRIYQWARKGKKEELQEPMTLTEFEETVGLLDEDDAKAYYEKWKNKW